MVGKKTMRKASAPGSAVQISEAKEGRNKDVTTKISGSGSEVYIKKTGQIVLRKQGRSGSKTTSAPAKNLKGCKGKRGCDFADCAKTAFGLSYYPGNLGVACGMKSSAKEE